MACFYTPNEKDLNNRTTFNEKDKVERDWDWQRETANTDALSHADQMIDSAMASYQRSLGQSGSAASPEANDYLYYALNAMDASHLNVVVVDTLGLPETDQHSHLYTQLITDLTRQNRGDLAVGIMSFQLDYAGKISAIGGRALENGFQWGYENFYYSGELRKGTLRWSYVQPMPRSLTALVIGPVQQVRNYTDVLCQWLDREMESGQFSDTRGSTAGMLPDSSSLDNSFVFNGSPYKAPEFGFKYKCTIMEYKDVVAEQRSLMSTLSQRLALNGAALRFDIGTETLPSDTYTYVTTVGNNTTEEDVPVITTGLGEPLTIAVDLGLEAGDTFTVSEGQYDSGVTVVSALETQSFTLEEIDILSRNGGLDLSESSEILHDQAYIDDQGRIYKYHLTDGSGLVLNVTSPTVVNGELQVVLSTDVIPKPGYYWVTLEMRSKTLAELDNANWNPIQPWMATDTSASRYDENDGPAVLSSYSYSWDYTPDSRMLNSYADTDARLGDTDRSAVAISFADGARKTRLTHAWGASGSEAATLSPTFPANIPPVFRAFQLNRIASSIRSGLLDRSGAINSAPFLTRHFIICVPETTTAGAE